MTVLILLAAIFVPFVLGSLLAKAIRMADYGWKFGLILSALGLSTFLVCKGWPPQRGIDLKGGVILIYEIDETQTALETDEQEQADSPESDTQRVKALVDALTRRINPGGVKEVVIRPYGPKQVEIIIPEVNDAEIEKIKKLIVTGGFLKFRILADQREHQTLFNLAEQSQARQIKDEQNEMVGEWVRVNPESFQLDGSEKTRSVGDRTEVLMVTDSVFDIQGKHLRTVSGGYDGTLTPCVNFRLNGQGASMFGGLTSTHLPDQTGHHYRLGIVMDNELISAPRIMSTITDNGQITGRFTQEEVDELVNILRAGRLPAVIRPDPISENKISPLLGEDTIRRGQSAISISLVAVLIFMAIYYRFAGLVACFALAANLLLILALVILLGASLTLPGLAGLVLTVGMSVDANVLIFERIREELRKGAALRMAVRNGFARATTTIVDANLTTLITAIVLYAIGTDQIRGFAVILILGILVSMFTAIFCSRVVFEIAERRRWISKLGMMSILTTTNFDFVGKRKVAAVFSLAVILVGLSAVVYRGAQIFDIDFLGGTSVQARLKEPMPIEDVRARIDTKEIADDVSITQVHPEKLDENTVYKIDTSLKSVEELKNKLVEKFRGDDSQSLLVSHSLNFTAPKLVEADSSSSATTGSFNSTDSQQSNVTGTPEVRSEISGEPAGDLQTQEIDGVGAPDSEATSDVIPVDETPTDAAEVPPGSSAERPTSTDQSQTNSPADTLIARAVAPILLSQAGTSETANSAGELGSSNTNDDGQNVNKQSESTLTFGEAISADTLRRSFLESARELNIPEPQVDLRNPNWDGESSQTFEEWTLKTSASPEQAGYILQHMKSQLESSPAWLSSNKIGGKVAGDAKSQAIAALIVSLFGIVAYIWIRFQRVMFGLAAVVALVHDVLVTLGAIAVSLWLSQTLGFLMIDEFKISLPIVAAFLTIIGYSLNDTIVVFDRIREVKGKSPKVTEEIINTSINQTLGRTILTSITTLIVVLILYVLGGQGIHGFAYALLVGVLAGTYSSVFVASPVLLWMSQETAKRPTESQKTVVSQ